LRAATFFEPAEHRGGRDAEDARKPPETGSLLVGAQYLLLAFFGLAVGRRLFAALASAGVTEIFLLFVGSEAIFDESSLPQ
jgi:hypothetical protein